MPTSAGRELRLAERRRTGRGSTRCCARSRRRGALEDSVLIAFSMYLNLNDSSGADEIARAQLARGAAAAAVRFHASARHRVGCAGRRRQVAGRTDSRSGSFRSTLGRCAYRCSQRLRPRRVPLRGSAVRRQQQLGRCGHARARQCSAARQRHASEPAVAAHLVSRALDRGVRRGACTRPGGRDVARPANAGCRQQRSYRVGLHEQLRRLVRPRGRRDRSAGSRPLPHRRRLRAVRESRRDAGDPRRPAGVPRRAEHALGTDHR